MKDPILFNKLWEEVEAGRVTASSSGDLTIFKYSTKTHVEDLWNYVNRRARGIILRTDGTIVARPFAKFFNLHERPETHPDNLPWNEAVEIREKLDGSCGIGYIHPDSGLWQLATPGSMESEQAIEGTKILNDARYRLEHLPVDCTPVFEIIYPANRIVVDYNGVRELVLLAIFEHNGVEWHPSRVDQIASLCGFRRPKRYNIDLRGDIPFEDNAEGYVARFESGLRVKIKSPTYLRIHRLLNYMTPKGVIELIRGREYGTTVQQLPPNIACDFDDIRAYVQGLRDRLFTQSNADLSRMLSEVGINQNRKNYATWIQSNVTNVGAGFVFALLDSKDIEDKLWKVVLEQVREECSRVLANE